jgi:hypothetical protein
VGAEIALEGPQYVRIVIYAQQNWFGHKAALLSGITATVQATQNQPVGRGEPAFYFKVSVRSFDAKGTVDTTGKLPVRIAERSPLWAPRSFPIQLAGRMKISCEHSGSPTVRQLPAGRLAPAIGGALSVGRL